MRGFSMASSSMAIDSPKSSFEPVFLIRKSRSNLLLDRPSPPAMREMLANRVIFL
jgi:hypothetical protein